MQGVAGQIGLSEAAAATGLSQEQIRALADQLEDNGPALVMDSRMSPAVVALNVQLGAWGRTIDARREVPVPDSWKKAAPVTALAAVPDRSIRVLLIDESAAGEYMPWQEIEKKLLAAIAWWWRSRRRPTDMVVTRITPAGARLSRNGWGYPARHRFSGRRVPYSRSAGCRLPQGVVNPSEFVGKLDLSRIAA